MPVHYYQFQDTKFMRANLQLMSIMLVPFNLVFLWNKIGNIKINTSQWDHKPGPLFTKLLEFEALQNHYTGKESWKKSKFAERSFEYLKKNNQLNNPRTLKRDFKNYSDFLSKREKQIEELFNSILKKGIYPMDLSLASNKYKKFT